MLYSSINMIKANMIGFWKSSHYKLDNRYCSIPEDSLLIKHVKDTVFY